MPEKKSENIIPVFTQKHDHGTILDHEPTIELDSLHVLNPERQKIWAHHEIANMLENETEPFTDYLEKAIPTQTNTQREKKLKEYHHITNILNQTLPNWTDITHNPSQIKIVSNQQETLVQYLTTQILKNNESPFATPIYLFSEIPQPYYINGALFYKESDIKKHLTYINFDPVHSSIISLYRKAVSNESNSSSDEQFQNIYVNCLVGYMNAVKMLYKTFTTGELIKQLNSKNENMYLLSDEYADQITHHALGEYIQKPGIVFPLQTITIFKKKRWYFFTQ